MCYHFGGSSPSEFLRKGVNEVGGALGNRFLIAAVIAIGFCALQELASVLWSKHGAAAITFVFVGQLFVEKQHQQTIVLKMIFSC